MKLVIDGLSGSNVFFYFKILSWKNLDLLKMTSRHIEKYYLLVIVEIVSIGLVSFSVVQPIFTWHMN